MPEELGHALLVVDDQDLLASHVVTSFLDAVGFDHAASANATTVPGICTRAVVPRRPASLSRVSTPP